MPFEPFPRVDLEGSLVARFARQVSRHGGRLAVKMGTHALTYAELDRAANRIAHALLARLGPGNEPVALLLPQGPGQVAAVLGALKAGKIYVPLDVAQPPRRLGDFVADSGARLIVTDSPRLGPAREAGPGAHLLDLDALPQGAAHEAPDLSIAPDAGAYIFYTSGSTGAPKGVLDTHRNVLHNVMRYTNTLRFGPDDRLTLLQGPSFSGAVSSLFGALLNGAASFPFDVPREGPEAIAPWLAAEGITIYHSVPALFRYVAFHGAALPALRVIRLEGDRATVRDLELFAAHFAEPCVLVNGLGATECGLVRQFFFRPGQPLPGAVVPIGGPVEDMNVVVLGEDGRPAPPGEVGEIAVRSAYLASGYWRRPDLTARRFLPDGERPGARMYLTGDTGRVHADGVLDYLGRQDGLAKVRGRRVEVAEVETALLAVPGVAEAAVMVREDRPGEPRVVAYLVAGAEGVPPAGALRRALAERLPDFMVPAAFVPLPHLPLDDNRKVDRRALPPPPAARPLRDRPAVAPRNDDEATIARLWGAALGLEEIGVEDDFFELGGDSLRAALMLAEVRKTTGLELGAAPFAESPTVAAIAQRLIAARGRRTGAAATIPRRPPGDLTPPRASFAQEALWFLDQLDPGTALYNVAPAWRIKGSLDVAALERALQHLVDRHESLRTVFVAVDGQPHQRVLAALTVPLPVTDCSAIAAEDREAEVTRAAAEERREGFDLARGPLIRARLFRLSPVDHVLSVTVHHIVTDGWSMDVLARELGHGYRSARAGREPELAPLPIQFADFAVWQRERLSGARLMRLLDYWRGRLAGRPAAPALPADHPRPARPTFQGGRERLAVSAQTLAAVRALGREEGATLYMVLLAAFALLLSRHTGQTDLLIGSPLADRTRRETWSGIGLYLNTLVLRIDLSGSPSFRELIRRVRANALDAFDHQELPFDRLVEALRPDRSAGPSYLSVLFNLHNQPSSDLALEGLAVEPVLAAPPRPKFELNLAVEETPDGLACALVYDAEIFEAETIRRLLDGYRHLLARVVAEPDRRIGEHSLMGEGERTRILALGRGPLAPPPPARSIQAAVAAQAARTPEARALVLGDAALSYAELERRANGLARHLRAYDGGADLRVGVCLPRSAELVIALLAVLKAGAAYVALDPAEPPARLGVILDDAGARAVITSDALARRCGGQGRAVIRVDADADAIAREDGAALEMDGGPDDLAYIAYTSGSTGRPKGVPTPHRGVLSYLDFLVRRFELGPADTVLQLCRASFDASVREIFGPLTSGGCLVLLRDDEAADPEAIVARLREHRVTALLALVPSVLRPAAAAAERGGGAETLRLILTTGEPLRFADARLVERALAPHAALVNQYGPTECTMTSTWYPVGRGEESATGDALVPIGRPIANVHVHVLDEGGELVPPGVPGDLHIGGVGVASGYLGDPDQTAQRFVPDPFTETPGARMFKTGDLVRRRADGTLEFLGRMDRQVKVRGIRVEPGETEHVLLTHPAVAEAAVMPWEAAPGDQRLAAYVVAREGATFDVADLRRFVRERLPTPLVPSAIIALETLPITSNGKLDRAALPLPDPAAIAGAGEYVAPRTPLETALVEVWSDVLGVPRIGVTDDFFELGGHSLLATRLLVRLRDRLGLELGLRQLFEAPTIGGMVDTLLEQELSQDDAEPAGPDAPASLAAVLAQHARQTPAAPAILAPGRPALSYRGLADEITRIGVVLAAAGLRRGARVALVMPQGPDLAVALLGVACAATALPLDPTAPRPELERLLAAARVDALIVLPGGSRPAREAADALGLRVLTLDAGAGARAGAETGETPRAEHVAVVLHTSGTTARPKRVPLTHANLLASAHGHGRALALTAADRCLNLMPLHHVNGLGMLVASLVAGAAVICPPPFDAARLFGWLETTRPSWLNASPAMHQSILRAASMDTAAAGSATRVPLRLIRSASSHLPGRVRRELADLFRTPVIESYGQTETATLTTVGPLPPRGDKEGSVGRPMGSEIALLGEDGRVLEGAGAGEILVRGANVMAGYEDDPEATRAVFVDGWLRTGDLGRLDADGYLHLTGRIKDVINRGGEKIAPAEIDEALLAHPDVHAALACAVPHPTLGEDVAAVVVARPGARPSAAGLRAWLAERLAEAKIPRRFAFVDDIPRGATGKPDREAAARRLNAGGALGEAAPVTLETLIAASAARAPEAAAIGAPGRPPLTYRALMAQLEATRAALGALGLGRGDRVAMALPQGPELAVVFLAAALGATAAPLNPAYREAEFEFYLATARARAVIVPAGADSPARGAAARLGLTVLDLIPEPGPAGRFSLALANPASSLAPAKPSAPANADDIALVIHTSGTTGRPKVIPLRHSNLVPAVQSFVASFRLTGDDRALDVMPLFHVQGLMILLTALASGGSVCCAPAFDPTRVFDWLEDARPTWYSAVPTIQQAIVAEAPRHPEATARHELRFIRSSAAPLPPAVMAELEATFGVPVIEGYGQSESCMHATVNPLPPGCRKPGSVGLPVGPEVSVVDESGRAVPVGETGEVVVRGATVMWGYEDDPEANAAVFRNGWYRTGDLGRFDADGYLAITGRARDVINRGGEKISPREVDDVLVEHPAVAQAVVFPMPHPTLGQDVAAAVVLRPGATVTERDLREFAGGRLAPFKLPRRVVFLSAIPKGPTGKPERRGLADMLGLVGTEPAGPEAGGPPAAGGLEEQVAKIWEEVLGHPVRRDADFITQGGDSLRAAMAVSRIAEATGVIVTLEEFFDAPTVTAVAERVARRTAAPAGA